jgi:[citrate (pro-3S)-lyase] ligase
MAFAFTWFVISLRDAAIAAVMTEDDLVCETVDVGCQPAQREEIERFLARCGLGIDAGVDAFVVCRFGGRMVACAGLELNIVKCVATDPICRGESISLKVVSEVIHLAYERGYSHLFLYTRPHSADFFAGCGFYRIVEVPGLVTIMENTPLGIRAYCRRLATLRQPGARIGAIVMNANPFTSGHEFLVRQALERCDWLHLFVVAEDTSQFSYADRFRLVREGIAGMERITLHPGSPYIISRATFSSYFFKEKGLVGDSVTAVDLLIFRNFIAPALGVTHRFVGTEPFCPTTRKYNSDMKHWLQQEEVSAAASVAVVEVPRQEMAGIPISASQVRRLLKIDDWEVIARLVPATTLAFLLKKYPSAAALAFDAARAPAHTAGN